MARELNKPTVLLCLLLAAVTLVVYWPVGHYEFVTYDDPVYVLENRHVGMGVTWAGLVWAFARLTGDGTYWHPVTWVSHMLDCQLFGVNPGPQHLVNLGFHAANGVLLFLVLRRMTQAVWRSAAVAALFALHPWQVETVAWVAERKNVLSTCFGLLMLLAYARYVTSAERRVSSEGEKPEVRKPKAGIRSLRSNVQSQEGGGRSPRPEACGRWSLSHLPSSIFYLLALLFFALGLMSKPMVVTLPFVLLLLDYWPLGRGAECGVGSAELGEGKGRFRRATWRQLLLEKVPFLAMSGGVVWVTMAGHERFSLGATWPAIPLAARLANGLVSYGRYIAGTFWPVKLAVLYPFPDHWPAGLVSGAGVLVAGVSVGVLWGLRQRPYLAVGWFWFVGTLVPVIGLVQDGAQAMADRYMYLPVIGLLLALSWGTAEMLHRLGRPGWAAPLAILALLSCAGVTRHQLQFWKNSVALFERATAVTKNNYIIEEDLGVALAKTGAMEEARSHIEASLRINPGHANGHFNLGFWLALKGQAAEAAAQYREAIRLRPNYAKALNNLAWMLATQPDPRLRDGQEAVQLARRAAELSGGNDAGDLDTLAAACAEAQQFAEAVSVAERAAGLAQAAGQKELARQIQARLQGYRSEQPYREPR